MKDTRKYIVAFATCFDESNLNNFTYSIHIDPFKLDHQNLKKFSLMILMEKVIFVLH